MKERTVILGIDGVPFELMEDLSNKNILPNFKDLKKEFIFKKLKSSIPHISSVSWSSIITGKNPGEHGIYGFTEMIENTYSLKFPNFNALKSKTFWQKNPEQKYAIINVPSTYPPKKLNGIHIAGFIALELEKAVYPKAYIDILKELNYKIDIDTKLAHQQSKEFFINELFNILEIRKKVFNFLWNELNWNIFMPVITGSDRIGHFLWHVYEEKKNIYHQRFLNYFKEIDLIIGNIVNKLHENDRLIILSDHGMERSHQKVNLNTCLEKEGFLKLSNNLKRYNRIMKSSKAFVLDPGRIYLNKKGKYPNGTVNKATESVIIEEIKNIFCDLRFNNQKVIKNIYKKNDIYSGKMINSAPDLVLIENKGFNINGSIGRENIFENETSFSGKHNEDAFILINQDIDVEKPSVEDITKLLGE